MVNALRGRVTGGSIVLIAVSGLLACEKADPPGGLRGAPSTDFAHPELLIETHSLSGRLSDAELRVLDVRPREDYDAGHVPGAIHVSRDDLYDPERKPGSMVGTAEQIAEAFGAKGVDEYTHVVVYDEGRATTAARAFWTLEHYGHPRVSVLNGGFRKWSDEGREVSTRVPAPEPATFRVQSKPEVLSTKALMVEDLADEAVVFLDARSEEEFSGDVARAERGGHVPGAVHLEWTRNFTDGETPVFKSALALRKMYEDAGVTRDKRVHAY